MEKSFEHDGDRYKLNLFWKNNKIAKQLLKAFTWMALFTLSNRHKRLETLLRN